MTDYSESFNDYLDFADKLTKNGRIIKANVRGHPYDITSDEFLKSSSWVDSEEIFGHLYDLIEEYNVLNSNVVRNFYIEPWELYGDQNLKKHKDNIATAVRDDDIKKFVELIDDYPNVINKAYNEITARKEAAKAYEEVLAETKNIVETKSKSEKKSREVIEKIKTEREYFEEESKVIIAELEKKEKDRKRLDEEAKIAATEERKRKIREDQIKNAQIEEELKRKQEENERNIAELNKKLAEEKNITKKKEDILREKSKPLWQKSPLLFWSGVFLMIIFVIEAIFIVINTILCVIVVIKYDISFEWYEYLFAAIPIFGTIYFARFLFN